MAGKLRRRDVPAPTLRALILSVLAERGMHGYLLAKTVAERSEGALSLPQGTLYPLLHDLEAEGLVMAAWERSPAGRRRRMYRITKSGRTELADWRVRWTSLAKLVRSVLAPSSQVTAEEK